MTHLRHKKLKKKKTEDNIIKDIRNLFRLKKQNKATTRTE